MLQTSRLSTDSDSTNNNMEVIFLGQNSNSSTYNNNDNFVNDNSVDNGLSSCKTLQRKLELKVEKAKRNYCHNQQEIRTVSIFKAKKKIYLK